MSKIKEYKVKQVKRDSHDKELLLELEPYIRGVPLLKECEVRRLRVPLSACVTGGDTVRINRTGAWVQCYNGIAQMLPTYLAHESLRIGKLRLDLLIKEVTDAEEMLGYEALSLLHYRSQSPAGRTARLVVRSFHPLYPSVIGYIELATPFYMNKARDTILNAPFTMDTNGTTENISWQQWDVPTLRERLGLIVRVARCVIYPEFRGVGLGQLLVKHAAEFAREHWHVAGWKPLWMETSADMLKFVPFAKRAGMTFVGETEGNLLRVGKDIEHSLRQIEKVAPNKDVSIVNQQAIRLRRAQDRMNGKL